MALYNGELRWRNNCFNPSANFDRLGIGGFDNQSTDDGFKIVQSAKKDHRIKVSIDGKNAEQIKHKAICLDRWLVNTLCWCVTTTFIIQSLRKLVDYLMTIKCWNVWFIWYARWWGNCQESKEDTNDDPPIFNFMKYQSFGCQFDDLVFSDVTRQVKSLRQSSS